VRNHRKYPGRPGSSSESEKGGPRIDSGGSVKIMETVYVKKGFLKKTGLDWWLSPPRPLPTTMSKRGGSWTRQRKKGLNFLFRIVMRKLEGKQELDLIGTKERPPRKDGGKDVQSTCWQKPLNVTWGVETAGEWGVYSKK